MSDIDEIVELNLGDVDSISTRHTISASNPTTLTPTSEDDLKTYLSKQVEARPSTLLNISKKIQNRQFGKCIYSILLFIERSSLTNEEIFAFEASTLLSPKLTIADFFLNMYCINAWGLLDAGGFINSNEHNKITVLAQSFADFLERHGVHEPRAAELFKEFVINEFPSIANAAAQDQDKADSRWSKRILEERGTTISAEPMVLPDKAPELWADRANKRETVPDFVKRNYGQWLRADASGLVRTDFKSIDPGLYKAVTNFCTRKPLPADCPIPTKSEKSDYLISQVASGGIEPDSPSLAKAVRALAWKAYKR
jgi:hypothetical protein